MPMHIAIIGMQYNLVMQTCQANGKKVYRSYTRLGTGGAAVGTPTVVRHRQLATTHAG